jgi:hypothetical protein
MKAFNWLVFGIAVIAISTSPTMLLADDDTHFGHSDFITRQAGDGIEVNKAAQTIDWWPKAAKNRKLDVDGKRAEVAMKRYEQNKSIPPRGLSTTTIVGQQGPGQQQSTSIQN